MPLHMTDGTFVKIWDVIEQDDYILKILDVDHIDKRQTWNLRFQGSQF